MDHIYGNAPLLGLALLSSIIIFWGIPIYMIHSCNGIFAVYLVKGFARFAATLSPLTRYTAKITPQQRRCSVTKIFTFITLILISTITLAADRVSEIEKFYDGIESLKCNFKQITYIELLERTIDKSGRLYLAKQNKFRIEYLMPDKRVYFSDGNKVSTYEDDNDDTLTQFSIDRGDISGIGLSILNNFKNLRKLFKVSENVNGADAKDFEITLVPKSKNDYKKIIAQFDEKNMIKKLKLFGKNGNVTEYILTEAETNPKLNTNLFIK